MLDKTIEDLTEKLTPVTPLRHPVLRILPYMLLSVIYISGVVALLGVRKDFELKIEEPEYLFELSVSMIASVTAFICAAYASVPGMRQKSWLFYIPLISAGVLLLWLTTLVITKGFGQTPVDMTECIRDGVLFCVIPTTFLVFMIRKGATTHPYKAAFSAALASTFIGWIGLRIICSLDQLAHVMITHMFSLAIISAILGVLAQRLLKW